MPSNPTEPADTTKPKPAILALGFRPFYLLAALFSVIAIPLWLAAYTGLLQIDGYLTGLAWHQHEMLFGFADAVIAGFLLTAVRNWTGIDTVTGIRLGALAFIWILARVLMFTGPALPAVLIDLAFLPLLAAVIAVPIWKSRSKRNYKLLLVLAALTAVNALYHLGHAGVLPSYLTLTAITMALDIITILIAIMAGRVIPAFTANAIPSAKPRQSRVLEIAAIGSLLLMLVADGFAPLFVPPPAAWASLFFFAAIAHAIRLWRWDPRHTYRNPLLLMLPVAYAWIPAMLVLRGLATLGLLPATAGVHALTVGAMTSMMLAMMMRSALGHTGRALTAGPAEIAAFVLLQLAAIVRVAATLAGPADYRVLVMLSGLLWASAFVAFLARYTVVLTQARVDGRPG